MRSLASLLGRSPFGPLQEHMDQVVTCAEGVPALFEALIAGDVDALRAQQVLVSEMESAADALKNDLMSKNERISRLTQRLIEIEGL